MQLCYGSGKCARDIAGWSGQSCHAKTRGLFCSVGCRHQAETGTWKQVGYMWNNRWCQRDRSHHKRVRRWELIRFWLQSISWPIHWSVNGRMKLYQAGHGGKGIKKTLENHNARHWRAFFWQKEHCRQAYESEKNDCKCRRNSGNQNDRMQII